MRQGKTLPGRISSRNGLPENKLILATSYSPTKNRSTIGAGELNCRVRDGNGCGLSAIITRKFNYLFNF
jgi:hypothetical protein